MRDDQVTEKETVFGFNTQTPGPSGSSIKLQIGLVRRTFAKNPVRTNSVSAAPMFSRVHADLTAAHQIADEDIAMGSGVSLPVAAAVVTNPAPVALTPAMPAPTLKPLVQTQ